MICCGHIYRPSNSSHPQPYGALSHYIFSSLFTRFLFFFVFLSCPRKRKKTCCCSLLLRWFPAALTLPPSIFYLINFIFWVWVLLLLILLFFLKFYNDTKGCDDGEHFSILIRTKASCLLWWQCLCVSEPTISFQLSSWNYFMICIELIDTMHPFY